MQVSADTGSDHEERGTAFALAEWVPPSKRIERIDVIEKGEGMFGLGFLPQCRMIVPEYSFLDARGLGVYEGKKLDFVSVVAARQTASTGMVALSYVQKVSEKVSLASDFMYNAMSRDVTASFGYDYILRQCRLRGKIDSNGVVAAFLEERFNMGLNFILSAEIDHKKKDYKFGFGLSGRIDYALPMGVFHFS
ncbi:Mitochondrial import receptor subunit TOM40-1 [Striga hermonthica]|uniref:Mitochondrial import receptor subunit TOM40-1 n=1 Tax=Striga hermonthica TaxID=68872 RepID=A0A9N7MQP8_STRHE|nr:Mitochondrial import receptor subunit TOM40-1 [Striga hermonthica]